MIIVDRIEEGIFAVCETDDGMQDVPLSKINGNVRAGDMLIDNGDGSFSIDAAGTEKRRVAMSERFERLKARENSRL